jgi:NADH:ubiquinone oxidoreductase subunit 4 (subunit M)
MSTSRDDRGQAVVMVVMIAAVLFVTMSAALMVVGGRMIDRTRAQTAADAAALASLQGGRSAALALVERYDAELVAYSSTSDQGSVTVVVRLGDATASAAATDAP